MKLYENIQRVLAGKNSRGIFRNMAVLALGAGSAKLIGLIAIPVLTRLYTPADFGVLSVFTALVALFVPIVTLRYVVAIPLPKSDRLAFNLVVLCSLLSVTLTVAIGLGIWLLGPRILPLLSMEVLLPFWWLIPVGVMGASIYEILALWATRKKAFHSIAKTQVWQMILGSIFKIGCGLAAIKPLGLLMGQVLQQSGGVFTLARNFTPSFHQLKAHVNKTRMTFLMGRYFDLPKFRLPSQFLLEFSMKAPLLFSAALFGPGATGQLGLAIMALGLPIQLLGNTTGKAYFAEIARIGKHHPLEIRSLTITVIGRLFLLGMVPCALLLLAGPQIFTFAFGEEWGKAGLFARLLSVYLLFQFVSSPLVNALTVFGKQKIFLYINIVRTFVVIAVFSVSFFSGMSDVLTIGIYSVCLAIHYLFVLFMVINNIK